jgi:SSS family solute:Na+ symporter
MEVTIVAIYLLAMLGVGFFLRSRVRSVSDFLVAGGKLGLVLTTATFAAVQLGAGVILGGAELGAQSGVWPGMWYGVGCGGGLILAGILVARKLRRHGSYVPMDFFCQRYGESRWIRGWAWLSNIPSLLGVFVAQIMAAGTVFTLFGFTYEQGVWVSGLVVMVYSVVSGMWGAVVTDFVQLTLILVGIPIVAAITLGAYSSSGGNLSEQILATSFVPQGMGPRAVFIILPFLLSMSVSYDTYMRLQSAKSDSAARWGAISGGILVLLISFCAGLVGAVGSRLHPELADGAVLPHMIQASLSPFVAGIVLAALLAAAMSTGNCLVISLAGSFARDFYNKILHPESELDKLPRAKVVSRTVVILAVLSGTFIALYAKGILYTMIVFNYPYMASMLVPLLGGVLWSRATPEGALAAMATGGCIGIVCFAVGIPGPLNGLFEIDLGLLLAYILSATAFITVSLATSQRRGDDSQGKPGSRIRAFIFQDPQRPFTSEKPR